MQETAGWDTRTAQDVAAALSKGASGRSKQAMHQHRFAGAFGGDRGDRSDGGGRVGRREGDYREPRGTGRFGAADRGERRRGKFDDSFFDDDDEDPAQRARQPSTAGDFVGTIRWPSIPRTLIVPCSEM